MRIGRLERKILSILLKHGAKTVYELAREIEKIDIRQAWTRQKAFLRTIKQLREKDLVVAKPYFKHEPYFVRAYSHQFWAEGTYWQSYNSCGFLREKTKYANYGFHHIFGLTHQGKMIALQK